uniref:Class E basic helix-loop-helix protein 40 n=1 Tax=Rousettus aegyptiacus TaxID=9407 RepID=A0A7J8JA80_ROUAE|nr:basic helix-loop-helix family member e41 [Rousettus aegyptiacus]
MDEGIPHLQERQLLEHRDFIGLDYSSLYMCKPKRSMKRDDSKDTYKLPHRLIEKKRRDRINECIAQLKDLLPEHLKLTTLGHLEKAVVLELTLKHLKALTALTEQQHQKIIALQNGERSLKSPIQSDLDAFHSGFQTCALRAACGRRGPLLPALLLPLAFSSRRLRAALPGQEQPGEVPVPGGGRRPLPAVVPWHPRPSCRSRSRCRRRCCRRLSLPVLGVVAPSREGGRRSRRDPPAARGGAPWVTASPSPARAHPPALCRPPRARKPGELCSGSSLAAREGNSLNPCVSFLEKDEGSRGIIILS